jgi:hypothetical protein
MGSNDSMPLRNEERKSELLKLVATQVYSWCLVLKGEQSERRKQNQRKRSVFISADPED